MSAISNLKPMIDVIRSHGKTLGIFLNGIESAEQGKDYTASLAAVKAGALAMKEVSETSKWMWEARFNLTELSKIRLALEGFVAEPETALISVGGRPVGYGTAQLWSDMAVEIVKGDWEEARERRKMSPVMLVLFAVGPLGIATVWGTYGTDAVGEAIEDTADAVEEKFEDVKEELEAARKGAKNTIFWLKVGAGVVIAGVAVAGTAAVVSKVRGAGAKA